MRVEKTNTSNEATWCTFKTRAGSCISSRVSNAPVAIKARNKGDRPQNNTRTDQIVGLALLYPMMFISGAAGFPRQLLLDVAQ